MFRYMFRQENAKTDSPKDDTWKSSYLCIISIDMLMHPFTSISLTEERYLNPEPHSYRLYTHLYNPNLFREITKQQRQIFMWKVGQKKRYFWYPVVFDKTDHHSNLWLTILLLFLLVLKMESSTILPLSHLSFLNHRPHHGHGKTTIGAFPFKQWKQTSSHRTLLNCQKMYVPGKVPSHLFYKHTSTYI